MFRLDHVPFAAADIEATNTRFRALGFRTVQGRCRWPMPDATYSAPSLSIMFADTYLDVIGWDEAPEALAPSGVVLGTDDFDAALGRLDGFELRPYEIERALATGETIRYRIAIVLGPGRLPISLLQDHDPAVMRTPEALLHPNGARRLVRVRLRAEDLELARHDLGRLTRDVEPAADIRSLVELEFAPKGPSYPWSA